MSAVATPRTEIPKIATHGPRYVVVLLGYLLLLLPVALGLWVGGTWTLPTIAAYAIAAYCGLRLTLIVASAEPRLLAMVFWLFLYVWVGLAGVVQTVKNEFPWGGLYSQRQLLTGLAVVVTGIVAFECGGLIAKNRPAKRGRLEGVVLSERRAKWLLVIAPLASLSVVVVSEVIRQGLLQPRVVKQALQVAAYDSTNAILINAFLRVPLFIAAVVALQRWRRAPREVRGRRFIVFAVLAVLTISVANPISSSRARFGGIALALLFAIVDWKRLRTMPVILTLVLTSVLLVFPYADAFRATTTFSIDGTPVKETFFAGDYDVVQTTVNATQYTRSQGIDLGRHVLGASLFWVPRSFWQTKPVPTGSDVAYWKGYNFLKIDCPLWAEGYVAGGFVGTFLLLMGYGYVTRRLDDRYVAATSVPSTTPFFSEVVVPIAAAAQFFLLRGSLMPALAYVVPIIITLALLADRTKTLPTRPVRPVGPSVGLRPVGTPAP